MVDQERDLGSEVLSFLQEYLQDHGYAPTQEEIRKAVGLCSRSHVSYYLGALEKKGLVVRRPRSPRGLCLAGAPPGLELRPGELRGHQNQGYGAPAGE